MKKSFDQYRRLAISPFGMSSIWMGEDHLVFVKGSGFILPFTEQYRRFRYQDIQYLAVNPTSRAGGIFLHGFCFITFAGAFAATLAMRDPEPMSLAMVIWLGILMVGAVFFLLLLTRHILLGPTCICDLKTNLKKERLTPLNRVHLAHQAIDILGEVVEQKQQNLVDAQSTPREFSTESLTRVEEEKLSVGITVLPAFLDYVGFGLVGLAALHFESIALCAAGLAMIVLGNVMLFASLIRSIRRPAPESIRKSLFGLLTAVMFFGGLAMVYFIHMAAEDPVFVTSVTGPFEAFAGIPTIGGMIYYFLFLASGLSILGIAMTGLVQTLNWRKKLSTK